MDEEFFSELDFEYIKSRLSCENNPAEFLSGKKLYFSEISGAEPHFSSNGKFPEIWIKKDLKKIYVMNLSGHRKEYQVLVKKYLGDDDILYHDSHTGMVYKPENGVIHLSLKSLDFVCINPNSRLYKIDYELFKG